MWKLIKTKTFWVGISGILAGLGAGLGMITADPPLMVEGVQTIIGAVTIGLGLITGRHAIKKIENNVATP